MFQIPIEPLLVFILVLARVLFFFSFLPVYSDQFLPTRFRVIAGFGVAIVFTPLLYSTPLAFPRGIPQFAGLLIPEALLGLSFGLVGRVIFGAIQHAGQIMGHEVGFDMAQQMDPTQSVQMPVVAQLLFICSLLVFFVSNAHHFFFEALAQSFQRIPPGSVRFSAEAMAAFFTKQGAGMFLLAVQLSLPVIAVIFVVNVALVMLSKGVPQIQVFYERFSICVIVGLFSISLLIGLMVRLMTGVFGQLRDDLSVLLGLLGG
jgi:flagellar biosynthesis protein FliR